MSKDFVIMELTYAMVFTVYICHTLGFASPDVSLYKQESML